MTFPLDSRDVHKIALLQHGGMTGLYGKTGLSLLRYRRNDIVAVVDQDTAGRDAGEVTGIKEARGIPIVGTVTEALRHSPAVLAIGIALPGGRMPPAWLEEIRTAVAAGVSIWNGLHTPLGGNPLIVEAMRKGATVWDMRREPDEVQVATGAARELSCRRILFVGTDMAIGKMTAALELDRAAKRRGLRSKFIATGQAGMMIAGDGIALDAVRVDFAAGAVENEVLRAGRDYEFLWVEGQGSLLNPASTATLPLMRGSQPTHLILVHRARMTHLRSYPFVKVPPLPMVVRLNEQVASAAGALTPARVVGIALNTWELSDEDAVKECKEIERATGLACVDTVRHGAERLLEAVLVAPTSSIAA